MRTIWFLVLCRITSFLADIVLWLDHKVDNLYDSLIGEKGEEDEEGGEDEEG